MAHSLIQAFINVNVLTPFIPLTAFSTLLGKNGKETVTVQVSFCNQVESLTLSVTVQVFQKLETESWFWFFYSMWKGRNLLGRTSPQFSTWLPHFWAIHVPISNIPRYPANKMIVMKDSDVHARRTLYITFENPRFLKKKKSSTSRMLKVKEWIGNFTGPVIHLQNRHHSGFFCFCC